MVELIMLIPIVCLYVLIINPDKFLDKPKQPRHY